MYNLGTILNIHQRNPDGFMQWPEFLELQRCLLAWHNMFRQCDVDRSGYIEATELAAVINKFGKLRHCDVDRSTQTELYKHSRWLESGNFGFRK